MGLVTKIVENDVLEKEVETFAAQLISTASAQSLALTKKMISEVQHMKLEEALDFESDAFMQTMRSEDASRLMRAYLASERPLNEQ